MDYPSLPIAHNATEPVGRESARRLRPAAPLCSGRRQYGGPVSEAAGTFLRWRVYGGCGPQRPVPAPCFGVVRVSVSVGYGADWPASATAIQPESGVYSLGVDTIGKQIAHSQFLHVAAARTKPLNADLYGPYRAKNERWRGIYGYKSRLSSANFPACMRRAFALVASFASIFEPMQAVRRGSFSSANNHFFPLTEPLLRSRHQPE